LAVASVALGAYAYALYLFGRWLARRRRWKASPKLATSLLAVAWVPVAVPAAFLPMDPFIKTALVISLYILHAQPCCVGYWAGREIRKRESERRWNRNVDFWLSEWECRPSEEELPGEPQ